MYLSVCPGCWRRQLTMCGIASGSNCCLVHYWASLVSQCAVNCPNKTSLCVFSLPSPTKSRLPKTKRLLWEFSCGFIGSRVKKVKAARTRVPSVRFRSWSRFLTVSMQVTWVIHPSVGCDYFPPGLKLLSQPLRGLLSEARWVWAVCLRLLPAASRMRFEPGPFCAWVQHANHSATEPPGSRVLTSEQVCLPGVKYSSMSHYSCCTSFSQ